MTAYVGKRLLLLIPTLLGVSLLTFLLIHLIPGDLVTILLGITASQNEQTRQALIHALHLDRPLALQYLLWLGEVLRGDLGHSLVTGFSVRDELVRSYPVTLQLALMAMSIALAVGIPLGVLAATQAGHDVAATYTQPPRPAGRGKQLQASPVQQAAEALGIAVRHPAAGDEKDDHGGGNEHHLGGVEERLRHVAAIAT